MKLGPDEFWLPLPGIIDLFQGAFKLTSEELTESDFDFEFFHPPEEENTRLLLRGAFSEWYSELGYTEYGIFTSQTVAKCLPLLVVLMFRTRYSANIADDLYDWAEYADEKTRANLSPRIRRFVADFIDLAYPLLGKKVRELQQHRRAIRSSVERDSQESPDVVYDEEWCEGALDAFDAIRSLLRN